MQPGRACPLPFLFNTVLHTYTGMLTAPGAKSSRVITPVLNVHLYIYSGDTEGNPCISLRDLLKVAINKQSVAEVNTLYPVAQAHTLFRASASLLMCHKGRKEILRMCS